MSKRSVSLAAKEIIESMGLKRGRGRINSVVSRSAAKIQTAQPTNQPSKASALALSPAGPINRFMYLEARKWAIELVASLRGSPVEVVIERLNGATEGRPASYVAGIRSVIGELQAGAGHD
ncbi:hypothetical protein QEP21_08335 [Pseudomonas shirazica]|uniref:hypothetical protein n=1 Tax=Pseudomonas shirazica TaxID=1940636 RepID=UPI002452B16D|nr:hypothetical protein [Pseudomonas shirazica]MDH4430358.1 hypothetical protein [Pseudomonas shirazica]